MDLLSGSIDECCVHYEIQEDESDNTRQIPSLAKNYSFPGWWLLSLCKNLLRSRARILIALDQTQGIDTFITLG